MTDEGRHVWSELALPKIGEYYGQALEGLSIDDLTHTLHYLLRILENMQRLDNGGDDAGDP
jgi:hypothetical protein